MILLFFFFFFQAEDGIRDDLVTGVQTCALPISGDQRGGRLNAAKVRVRVTACSPANRNTASATPSVVRCQYARARPSGDQAGDAPCSPSGCRALPSAPTTKRLSGPPTVVAREKARRSPS